MPGTPAFVLRPAARRAAAACMALLLAGRAAAMMSALRAGDPGPLLAFPFGAILPALLSAGLMAMGATRTREGLLMRVGALIQLSLIVALPPLALHLALGFPVVFLVVELFETRVPRRVRDPLARLVVA